MFLAELEVEFFQEGWDAQFAGIKKTKSSFFRFLFVNQQS